MSFSVSLVFSSYRYEYIQMSNIPSNRRLRWDPVRLGGLDFMDSMQ